MENIQMVDLKSQYLRLKKEIDKAIQSVVENTQFIKGPEVALFEKELSEYLSIKHVIGCANGTDALQAGTDGFGIEAWRRGNYHSIFICVSSSKL